MSDSYSTGTVIPYKDYSEFKSELDAAVKSTCQDFVKIGYYLKQARDTGILQESGYSSMKDFALAEYNIDSSTASRFIGICEKYSKGGNSLELREEYAAFQVSKLSEMLTLPEVITEELDPAVTRAEIRELKDAAKEEEKTSQIEVMIEAGQTGDIKDPLRELVKQYLHEHPEEFKSTWMMFIDAEKPAEPKDIFSIIAAAGYCTIMGRIPGEGRKIINIKSTAEDPTYTDLRTESKTTIAWSDLIAAFSAVLTPSEKCVEQDEKFKAEHGRLPNDDEEIKLLWEDIYHEAYPSGEKPEKKPEKKGVTVTKEAKKPQKKEPEKKPEDKPKKETVYGNGITIERAKNPLGEEKEKIAPAQDTTLKGYKASLTTHINLLKSAVENGAASDIRFHAEKVKAEAEAIADYLSKEEDNE